MNRMNFIGTPSLRSNLKSEMLELQEYFQEITPRAYDFPVFCRKWSNFLSNSAIDQIGLTALLVKTTRLLHGLEKHGQRRLKNFLGGARGIPSWLDVASRQLESFDTRGLASAMKCFDELRYSPPREFLLDVLAEFRDKMQHTNILDCADIFATLAGNCFHPGPSYMQDLYAATKSHLATAPASEIASIVFNISRLGEVPTENIMSEIYARMSGKVDEFKPGQLIVYVTGFTSISAMGGKKPSTLHVTECLQSVEKLTTNAPLALQNAAVYFDLPEFTRAEITKINFEPSPLDVFLQESFARVAILQPEKSIPVLGENFINVYKYDDKLHALVIDNPGRFNETPEGDMLARGNLELESALIAKMSPDLRVLRLNYSQANILRHSSEMSLTKLVKDFSQVAPGIYLLEYAGDRYRPRPFPFKDLTIHNLT